MQIYSHSIWLLLTLTIVLIHAKNIHFDFVNQLDDNLNGIEQQPEINYIDRHLRQQQSFPQKLLNLFRGQELSPYEQQRSSAIARRAKTIIKGDPREFMG